MNSSQRNRFGALQAISFIILASGVAAGGLAFASPPGATGGHAQSTRKSTDGPLPPRGKLGQDLFLAIIHEDSKGIDSLLKRGADPNSTNGLEFRPLYVAAAAHEVDAMQALLQAGAKPDVGSTYGTALTFAAMTGNVDGAKLLLDHGVNPDPVRTDGMTPLMMAANVGAVPLVAELLKHKVDVNAQDDGGETALSQAARNGFTDAAQTLIGAGAKVDAADMDGETPLMLAALNGHADTVKMLLGNGAQADARDKAGRTALILSASYGDYPDVVRALLDAKADANAKDSEGRTAATLAESRGYPGAAAALTAAGASRVAARAVRSPRQAVALSLRTIESSILHFDEGTACVSCHQEGLARITTGEAKAHGFTLDPQAEGPQTGRINGMCAAMRPLHEQALKSPEAMKQIPLIEINEVNDTYSWLLSGMAAHGQPANEATAAMAMVLARQQSPDGSWTFTVPRVPLQSSFFTFTALAVHSLRTYGPKAHAADIAERIEKAKDWFLKSKAQTSEDRASRLLGLRWSGASAEDIRKAAADVLADQRADGGWSQTPDLQSDAYATGQALYALHVGGRLPVSDGAYRRGEAFLLRTQDDDGTWFVNKRAIPANNYFDAGFPHGESQYASFNGTCWATLALLQG